jgi:hypothetical protein
LTLMLQCKKSGALNIVSANSLREKRSLHVSGREASGYVKVIWALHFSCKSIS